LKSLCCEALNYRIEIDFLYNDYTKVFDTKQSMKNFYMSYPAMKYCETGLNRIHYLLNGRKFRAKVGIFVPGSCGSVSDFPHCSIIGPIIFITYVNSFTTSALMLTGSIVDNRRFAFIIFREATMTEGFPA
ncbi:hypothetical protein Tcan_01558, partial [Toxocara canis]